MGWNLQQMPDQVGKTFIVTGGNTGIGLTTVSALASKGATVILACRNAEKGQAALAGIKAAQPDAKVSVELLDLASLASIKAFAERMTQQSRLDVLINNAGLIVSSFGHTVDGFETQFGTNVLGTFALTGLLLPLLMKTDGSRVATLSSTAHWFGKIDFDNLNAEKKYDKVEAYNQTKLADLMIAYELQRRLTRSGAKTISIGVHPGVTSTELFRDVPFLNAMLGLVWQSAEQGAWPTLMAALDPQLKGGEFVGPGGFLTMRGVPTVQKSSARSHDLEVAAKLWTKAEEMTGVRCLS